VEGNADDETIVDGRREMLDSLIVGVEIIGKKEGVLVEIVGPFTTGHDEGR